MSEPTLHPNLAKLAAAYDEILERLSRNQISTVAARAEIAQLEARDDEGVRWNIDPDSGEWVRKTALGDYEFDAAPPTYGYVTPDAFDYTANPQVFNPSERLQMAAVNDTLEAGPSGLAGATRARSLHNAPNAWQTKGRAMVNQVSRLAANASGRTKMIVAAVVVVLLALALHSCSSDDAAPQPTPQKVKSATTPAPKAHAQQDQNAKKSATKAKAAHRKP